MMSVFASQLLVEGLPASHERASEIAAVLNRNDLFDIKVFVSYLYYLVRAMLLCIQIGHPWTG